MANAGHMRWRDRPQSSEQELSTTSGLGPATASVDNSASEGLEGLSHLGGFAEGGVREAGVVVSGEGCGDGDVADASLIKRDGRGCGNDLGKRGGIQEQARASDSHMADARYDESQGWIAGQDTSAGASAGNSTWNEPASCRISHGDSHMADTDHESVRGGRPAEAHGPETSDAGEAQQREWVRSDTRTDGFGGSGFWSDHIWLTGADGKSRRSKPGLPLLAHGIPNRVGRLRAYGNAIVPQVAAEVIKAFLEAAEAA
jgi:hypothetical protein